MKNFGYCIWLTTSKNNHQWSKYTNGFKPHITIKYNLNLEEASFFFKSIETRSKYKIKLSDKLYYSFDNKDKFYCLYKKAFLIDDNIPEWFPLDAHVSFYYSYLPISNEIFHFVENKIKQNIAIFDSLQIKLCNDHFLLW